MVQLRDVLLLAARLDEFPLLAKPVDVAHEPGCDGGQRRKNAGPAQRERGHGKILSGEQLEFGVLRAGIAHDLFHEHELEARVHDAGEVGHALHELKNHVARKRRADRFDRRVEDEER